MTPSLILYSFRRCPFAMRVRIALHEKKCAFETNEEDLKNFSPELLRLHPEAKVPVLVHGDTVIYESAVILEYIEERFPQPALMPPSPEERAVARLWVYWCNQHFKPSVDRLKYGTARFSAEECVGIDDKVSRLMRKLEARLEQADWLVGMQISLADIAVFPFCRQLFQVQPAPSLLGAFPNSKKWLDRMAARPSFSLAMQ
jgi:glutathione S-transferase